MSVFVAETKLWQKSGKKQEIVSKQHNNMIQKGYQH